MPTRPEPECPRFGQHRPPSGPAFLDGTLRITCRAGVGYGVVRRRAVRLDLLRSHMGHLPRSTAPKAPSSEAAVRAEAAAALEASRLEPGSTRRCSGRGHAAGVANAEEPAPEACGELTPTAHHARRCAAVSASHHRSSAPRHSFDARVAFASEGASPPARQHG